MDQLHFCCGLPRTGSTVLMNILQQNPHIFTTNTCALPGLLKDHVLINSRYRESFQAMTTEQVDSAMYGFVQAGSKGWFEGLTNKPVVISKNRDWTNLMHLFPESKLIVCVRDLRDIVESFDRVNSKLKAIHTYTDKRMLYPSLTDELKFKYFFEEGNALSSTLFDELPKLMHLYMRDKSKVCFIRYEDLVKEPLESLKQIYSFLNLDYFNHDLNDINQSELYEHDNAYFRERTSHKVKSSFMNWKEPRRILSENFHNNIVNRFTWYYEGFYPEVLNNERQ